MEEQAIVEELMAKDAQRPSNEALQHAIASAELYLRAYREAGPANPPRRAALRQKFNELAMLAERLKSRGTGHGTPETEPQQPTLDEKRILERSSCLHGNIFQPWRSDPLDEVFAASQGEQSYTDSTDFAMSGLQQSILDSWKRPAALLGSSVRSRRERDDALMAADGACDLVQDITTDCSVVASLCAAMRILMFGAGGKPLLSGLMFPYDNEKLRPRVSSNGKYIFRMHFNGCFREVTVDDRLPVSRGDIGRNLFVVDRRNPDLLWPALMEKAYLKVRGGYDFPGSNSGTDLWVLTGWIPEQVFLQSEDVDLEHAWERIVSGYRKDNVIITLGTGRLSPTEEETIGLVGEHDYAVLEVDGKNGASRLLVKNPWCDGLVWKGADSVLDGAVAGLSLEDSSSASGAHLEMTHPQTSTGTFWISLEEVAQNFESMYLNWNPACFPHRQDRHFTWTVPAPTMADTFAYNPQYCIQSRSRTNVWILLSRHFADEELEIARNERPGSLAAVARRLGYTSISIFENRGKRVQAPGSASYRGPYVDSPQTLAKFDLEPDNAYTVVMAQEDLPLSQYACTFSFFSDAPLEVRPAEDEMSHYREVSGSWTRRSAGGNASSHLYSQNPQFAIELPHSSPLSVLLATGSRQVAIHVDLVWSSGKRVTAIGRKDVVASSGDYRCGVAHFQVPRVEAGSYVVVCSTFESGQLADFTMRLGAMTPFTIRPVPGEGAGLLRSIAPPLAFVAGEEKKQAKLSVSRLTRAYATVSCSSVSDQNGQHFPRVSLRMSLVYGRGPQASLLAISADGAFREPGGTSLRTSDFDIEPERLYREDLWLVVELLGIHAAWGGVRVEMLGDNAIHIGPWQVVDV